MMRKGEMLPITLPRSTPFPALVGAVPLVLFVEAMAGCGVGLAVGAVLDPEYDMKAGLSLSS